MRLTGCGAWLLCLICATIRAQPAVSSWKFAVSGDSRNCGDIVMPAIASGVRQNAAEFYWHLGDFRTTYAIDEDMLPPASLGLSAAKLSLAEYQQGAGWDDFIAHQLASFGELPVFLIPGNHETTSPSTRERYLIEFADWIESPILRAQRLKDDPQDHKLRAYYHWVNHNIDFIALDNASADQFDQAQLKWFHSVLQHDEATSEIRTIVVAMHAALPGSIGSDHSMSATPQGETSGREVYESLWRVQAHANKRVYVLASHSHFYMEDVYRTEQWKDMVLPGWIVGTAGAVRYRLPAATGSRRKAMTDVYGYLLGSVAKDSSVSFSFIRFGLDDLMGVNRGKYPDKLIRWCFEENRR
jgi:hypothetical protein